AAVTAEARHRRPGQAGDDPAGVDLADAVDLRLGDVELAGGTPGKCAGFRQLGVDGRSAVAVAALRPRPHHGGDDPVGVDLPDAVVGGVGDIEVAGGVVDDALRIVELGLEGRAAVAGEVVGALVAAAGDDGRRHTGHRRDGAAGIDHPDDLVEGIGDVHVAGGVEGHHAGLEELGSDGRAVVAAVARPARAGHARDGADLDGGIRPGPGDESA